MFRPLGFLLHHCTTFSIFFSCSFLVTLFCSVKKKNTFVVSSIFFLFFPSPSNTYIPHCTYIYRETSMMYVAFSMHTLKKSWPRSSNQSKKNLYVIQQDVSSSFVLKVKINLKKK